MSAPERSPALLNVIDVEATCWDGPAPAPSEIIEIGLCVVDVRSRKRVESDRILVRPVKSRVSPFCTELTGLTQEEVDTGLEFREACAELVRRHGAADRRWASWGDYDRKQFARQYDADGVDYPFPPRHVNAKRVFAEAHGVRQRGMARALEYAGLPLEGRHHSGLDDAWNIAALVLYLMDRGDWPTARGGAVPPRDEALRGEAARGRG